MNADSPRLRLGVLGIVAVSLFAALFARLWYLQVLASPDLRVTAEANRVRVVAEQAPRGRILDRNGTVLVDNRISVVVTVDRRALEDTGRRGEVLARLAAELTHYGKPMTLAQLDTRLSDVRFSPYTPVPVAEDVSEELLVYLSEHRTAFPGVAVEPKAVRAYPFGSLAAHVLGYVGPITGDELAAQESKEKTYQQGDEIGKSGIERVYEDDLRGVPGERRLEVDAAGNTVRELSYRPPVAGDDVVLTLDANIQGLTEQALKNGLADAHARRLENGTYPLAPAGASVVLDPKTGSVLALASFPTYDPSSFVNGIDSGEWAALQDPANYAPLNDRAIQGQYAPGSTFKLITAYAALKSGLIVPETTISDPGYYRLNPCKGETCTFYNAGSRPYGRVDLRRGITVSSDVYFYTIGGSLFFRRDEFGDPIQDAARQFGLGTESGVPLPYEQDGFVADPASKAARHDANPTAFPDGTWRGGDNVNIAIGQGDMLVTPLQLANAYATFANGGTLYSPNVASEVRRGGTDQVVRRLEPRVQRTVDLPPTIRQPILDGLLGVTTQPGGTARAVFGGFPNDTWPVAAKTGTAEVTGKDDTAVFAAFGPAYDPQYVVVTMMEQSGFGGVAAAPVVRRILEPLADPTLMPTVGPGGVLSVPVITPPDPQSNGEVID